MLKLEYLLTRTSKLFAKTLYMFIIFKVLTKFIYLFW